MTKESHKFSFFANRNLNPTRVVVVGFAGIILLGAVLLWLPLSSRSGTFTNPLTCLFTATSATCVTGLVQVDTWLHWSFFGQALILLLIQLGGLGFVTLISLIAFALHQKIGLSQRLVMASALNLNGTSGVVRMVRRALVGTFAFEGVGALLLATRFVPLFGWKQGIWFSVFHSVSAFCNGGFDLMGEHTGPFSSLAGFVHDPVVLLTLMALIILGGLGFFLWEDMYQNKFVYKKLSLYSQMALKITFWLILFGTFAFLSLEWNNPATLGELPPWQRVLNAMFQSVTLRTAGFATLDQSALDDGSALVAILFMLIGGCSGSTAGGLKTVTLGVLLLALRDCMKGEDQVVFRGRTVPHPRVLSAMVLLQVVLFLFFCGMLALTITDNLPFLPSAFEVASAMGTAGLSMNLTTRLNPLSSVVIIVLMFLGRVGILSFSIAFLNKQRSTNILRYPTVDMMVG